MSINKEIERERDNWVLEVRKNFFRRPSMLQYNLAINLWLDVAAQRALSKAEHSVSIWVVQEVMSHRIGTAFICTGLVRYSTVVYAAACKKLTLAVSRGEILMTKTCTRGSM